MHPRSGTHARALTPSAASDEGAGEAARDDEAELLKFRAGIERSSDAIFMTAPDGTITYVNPAFETLYGFTRDEAVGRTPRLLKSGEQGSATYEQLWSTLLAKQVSTGQIVNRAKDGRLVTVYATANPILDRDGDLVGFLAIQRDMTTRASEGLARAKLEEQFRQAQKMEAVGRLAGGVAHDFNNILSVILSYAEMMASELQPEQPFQADVAEIRAAALRASELTRQLLAFSRQQVLEPKVLDIGRSVASTENMLRRLLGADVELTVLGSSALRSVKADPGQVEQILMNLAVNARDAMPRGGKLTIETANVDLDDEAARAHEDVEPGSYVLLAVSDTGTGMDEETQARVFEPFFTTKEQGKGTGLGLSTVFGIVKQSGGHIWLYSEPGMGTTFKIYFPQVSGSAMARPSQHPSPETLRGNETVLVVEDDDQVRAVARTILRRSGYVVLEAPNGGEALLICEQHRAAIHLLVTDVVLPRMSGRQLAERLASVRPEMKVLFMSGHTESAIVREGILDSGTAFLQKPLTPTSLTSKVREVLNDTTPVEVGQLVREKRSENEKTTQ